MNSQKLISLYKDGNVGLTARKGEIALTFFSAILLPCKGGTSTPAADLRAGS